MNRVLILVLAMFFSLGSVTAVMAQGRTEGEDVFEQKLSLAKTIQFEGTVLSHVVTIHCVVVRTTTGDLTLQDDYAKYHQEYNRAKGLKIGSKVVGTYKTVDHINYAIWIGDK